MPTLDNTTHNLQGSEKRISLGFDQLHSLYILTVIKGLKDAESVIQILFPVLADAALADDCCHAKTALNVTLQAVMAYCTLPAGLFSHAFLATKRVYSLIRNNSVIVSIIVTVA